VEPLVAISLAGNIVQFVEFGTTVVLRLEKFPGHLKERLEIFIDIAERLPLFLDILGRMRTQIIQGTMEKKSTQETLVPHTCTTKPMHPGHLTDLARQKYPSSN
jgi:hypothetical protein